jgi:hypothetical protein
MFLNVIFFLCLFWGKLTRVTKHGGINKKVGKNVKRPISFFILFSMWRRVEFLAFQTT